MIRIWLVAAGIACGVLVMSVGSTQLADMRAQIATLPGMAWLKAETAQAHTAPDAERHADHDNEGAIKLSDQQIAAAGIDVGKAQAGVLSRRRSVPGLVTPERRTALPASRSGCSEPSSSCASGLAIRSSRTRS